MHYSILENTKFASCIIAILSIVNLSLIYAEQDNSNLPKNPWDAVTEGKLIKHIRIYYMQKDFDAPEMQESLAAGGWLGYETAPWHGINVGLIGYTSQGVGFTDKNHDGADLLAPGQRGYTVLGQAYLKAELEKNKITIFRQNIDTPFINPHDSRMTPNTYEAYTIESAFIRYIKIFISQITKVKGWTDTKFISMSEFAGIKDSDKPVTAAGITFTPNDIYKVQIWNYYCYDFMNVAYFEVNSNRSLSENLSWFAGLQAFYQQSVGEELFGKFHTSLAGVKTGVSWYGLQPLIGFTITDRSHDIVNPWSSWLGYTSIIEEDSNLAGEKAWIVGLSYDFANMGINGLDISLNYTDSKIPANENIEFPKQREKDCTINYHFSGKLNGLWLQLRVSIIDYAFDVNMEDYNSYRVILNYDF